MSGIKRTNAPVSDWLSDFADKVEKESLATTPVRDDITSQISEIVSGTKYSTPYSTVAEAVEDYQKRIGLFEYRKRAIAEMILEETAAEELADQKKNPEIIEKFPEIENFVINLVGSQYGIQLPAVLNSILEVFDRYISESDLDDPDLARYINQILLDNYKPDPPISPNVGKSPDMGQDHYDNPLSGLQVSNQFK